MKKGTVYLYAPIGPDNTFQTMPDCTDIVNNGGVLWFHDSIGRLHVFHGHWEVVETK